MDAVTHLLKAVQRGQGTQAQFNHPELGGMGQWSLGGMTMIGDMFNNGLKARVDGLCTELSRILRDQNLFADTSQTATLWPRELGQPASVGAQNNMRYAYFPSSRRLAIDLGGKMTVYDTGDHQIGGFSQSQSGGQNLTFTSQYGPVQICDLRVVQDSADSNVTPSEPIAAPQTPEPEASVLVPGTSEPARPLAQTPTSIQAAISEMSDEQIFARIERLADLFGKGILSQSEFDAKKTELLARL
ncbi:hypothetical protein P775_14660 [Puniceibacterium antarcticum]|uniref:SHOCT domain-containing protein n=2 Tax=Puniceibacterium antarcticum TaxID=1206336 RepID=A0A2G8RCX3_9RHOB|nr:hypothetical protein P775_14660 [Puniceibacterium antarcticum]